MKKYKDVNSYIKDQTKDVQAKLNELRKAIKSVAPKAEEKISYGMPSYHYHGRLVYYAGWKDHVSIYALFSKDLDKYRTGKGNLAFSLDEKLPIALIKKG